ncbi:14997_t:CDS:2, partial [Rhizophagus irregularis]
WLKKKLKSSMVTVSVGEEEVMDLKSVTGEVSVSKEEVDLYNKVNQACSSRLPPEI